MTDNSPDELFAHAGRVNLLASLDVSGRGGNIFFLTIFDRHPQVAGCALVQYSYTYVDTQFGDTQEINARDAHAFVTQKSYSRLLYNEPDGATGDMISRLGGDVRASFDRALFRRLIDSCFRARRTISRRELIAVPSLAYAAALGRNLGTIKYVMVGDAISIRQENVVTGFSGRIVDAMLADFPDARLVRLIRDPRATFASPRHQFVNSFGNMYAIKPSTFFSRFRDLLRTDLRMDNGAVYLYWLLYIRQAEIAARRKSVLHARNFLTVLNEDLNIRFPHAMKRVADWLEVSFQADWSNNNFVPTIMGAPWLGTGAYNSRYQRAVHGPLANDSDEVASTVTGPNEYVTRRWRTRLNRREIELIERLFREEVEEYGYDVLYDRKDSSDLSCLMRTALLPFEGELPTIAWLKTGWALGLKEFVNRGFYSVTFPPFYILSRIILFNFVLRRRIFSAAATPATKAAP